MFDGRTSELAYPKEWLSNGVMFNLKYFHSNAWEHLALGCMQGLQRWPGEQVPPQTAAWCCWAEKPLLYREKKDKWGISALNGQTGSWLWLSCTALVCLIPSLVSVSFSGLWGGERSSLDPSCIGVGARKPLLPPDAPHFFKTELSVAKGNPKEISPTSPVFSQNPDPYLRDHWE